MIASLYRLFSRHRVIAAIGKRGCMARFLRSHKEGRYDVDATINIYAFNLTREEANRLWGGLKDLVSASKGGTK